MTNVKKVEVLSNALHALNSGQQTEKQAGKVADLLVEACKKLASEKAAPASND